MGHFQDKLCGSSKRGREKQRKIAIERRIWWKPNSLIWPENGAKSYEIQACLPKVAYIDLFGEGVAVCSVRWQGKGWCVGLYWQWIITYGKKGDMAPWKWVDLSFWRFFFMFYCNFRSNLANLMTSNIGQLCVPNAVQRRRMSKIEHFGPQYAICLCRGQNSENPTQKALRFKGYMSNSDAKHTIKLGKQHQKDK